MLRFTTIATTALFVTGIVKSAPPQPGWEHHPPEPMTYKEPLTAITFFMWKPMADTWRRSIQIGRSASPLDAAGAQWLV